jgi:rubrerythrin
MNKQAKSKTEQNLNEAFAGEAMANRKYLYFAKQARRLGNEEIARLFENIAEQETAHAFSHLELIYPAQSLTVHKLLELARDGELYETNQMYPEFERIALEEKQAQAASEFVAQARESAEHAEVFEQAAKRFHVLAKVEAIHAGRYEDALKSLDKDSRASA